MLLLALQERKVRTFHEAGVHALAVCSQSVAGCWRHGEDMPALLRAERSQRRVLTLLEHRVGRSCCTGAAGALDCQFGPQDVDVVLVRPENA